MKFIHLFPDLDGNELLFIQELVKDLSEEKLGLFASIYRSRRRDPNLILLTALLGFIGLAGIHRFLLSQIGMGILYFFTAGLCFIGTIIDLVNYKNLAFEYNQNQARQVMLIIKTTD